MPTKRQIDLQYVTTYCENQAAAHKLSAAKEAQALGPGVKNAVKRDEHLAKAQMADAIADHFRIHGESVLRGNPEVESLAREIDPDAFGSYDAVISRLKASGHDDVYALQVAEATYGDRMAEARDKAAESIQLDTSNPDESYAFARGIEEAIAWHEARARDAETLEGTTKDVGKKAKYAQRKARHLLYAKHMRTDLIESRTKDHSERGRERSMQASLPFPEVASAAKGAEPEEKPKDIPLEVQMRFLKKTEVMDDEGW